MRRHHAIAAVQLGVVERGLVDQIGTGGRFCRNPQARIFVDKGYRGHDYAGAGSVMIAGQKRGLTPTMRRELRRRSAIEATIGHMKTDGRLDRNWLLGHAGDAVNALLAAAGHNLRVILNALALCLPWILAARQTPIAESDTSRHSMPLEKSMA